MIKRQNLSVPGNSWAVVRRDRTYRMSAARAIRQGESIIALEGESFTEPTRYSIQVGLAKHIDAPGNLSAEDSIDRHPWRCLNHSCAPNASIRGNVLVALRDIQAWQEIVFDYNTTEFELATPFVCECGADDCCGIVRGFRYLSAAERVQRAPYFAEHLKVFLGSTQSTS